MVGDGGGREPPPGGWLGGGLKAAAVVAVALSAVDVHNDPPVAGGEGYVLRAGAGAEDLALDLAAS